MRPILYPQDNYVTEQCVAILYRLKSVNCIMMSVNEEAFEEIWISGNYAIVFCTEEEKQSYLHLLSSKKSIPSGMSVVLTKKKLNKKYTKKEIMQATPDQLKIMTT
jgi:hypothetical protein